MTQLDPESPDVRLAMFGFQVKEFLDSDIGQYIQQLAQQDEDEALRQLALVDPDKPSEVRYFQNKVTVARTIIGWLTEAIQKGHEAIQVLEDE